MFSATSAAYTADCNNRNIFSARSSSSLHLSHLHVHLIADSTSAAMQQSILQVETVNTLVITTPSVFFIVASTTPDVS